MGTHISESTVLAMCVKTMNNTLKPEGLVPAALVFCIYPSTQILEEPRIAKPMLHKRAQLAIAIRSKTEQQMAALRVQRALLHRVLPAVNNLYEMGDQVLVF